MKLQRITLCDFRAFPGLAEYTFDFGQRQHLLIYGENGSGKTSVFRALVEYFDNDPKAKPFAELKNLFSDSAHGAALTCGKVKLAFQHPAVAPATAPTMTQHVWSAPYATVAEIKPSTDPNVQQLSRRKGLLDYHALLRANMSTVDAYGRPQRPNLFQLVVLEMLGEMEVTLPGGTVRTLSQLWDSFTKTVLLNQYFRGDALVRIAAAQSAFNDAVVRAITSLKARADGLLSQYFKHEVELSFVYVGADFLRHRKPYARMPKDGTLFFDLRYKGQSFKQYETVLNEAKQSAIALCVYFSALLDGKPKGVAGYPRLLVLDDVLIGLDMQNRMPVLRMLEDEFSAQGWQIILLTRDRVWYDYASHAASGIQWACHELYADQSPLPGNAWLDTPRLRTPDQGAGHYVKRAEQHMREHDHKAAAMYARAAYEARLRKYCEDRHLRLPFHRDAQKMSSDLFFNAAKHDVNDPNRTVGGVVTPVPSTDLVVANTALEDIRLHRQQVLNPMSHAHAVSLTSLDVSDASASVKALIDPLPAVPQ